MSDITIMNKKAYIIPSMKWLALNSEVELLNATLNGKTSGTKKSKK